MALPPRHTSLGPREKPPCPHLGTWDCGLPSHESACMTSSLGSSPRERTAPRVAPNVGQRQLFVKGTGRAWICRPSVCTPTAGPEKRRGGPWAGARFPRTSSSKHRTPQSLRILLQTWSPKCICQGRMRKHVLLNSLLACLISLKYFQYLDTGSVASICPPALAPEMLGVL